MKNGPEFAKSCGRHHTRHWLRRAGDAVLEIHLPDGDRLTFDLINISARGVCFGLDDAIQTFKPGLRFEHAVIRIGDAEIEGSLRVAHVTEEFSSGTLCGAEFEPDTEFDERRLVASIEATCRVLTDEDDEPS